MKQEYNRHPRLSGWVSIDIDEYSIDIPIDTRSTLYLHLINRRAIVDRVPTNSHMYQLIEN